MTEYKSGAKDRGLCFELTKEDFHSIVTKPCVYCGKLPEVRVFRKGRTGECSASVNGIDRVDSSKGYTLDNVVPCCTRCNQMKLNYETSDFLEHISKIYHFTKVKGSTTIENTLNSGSE